MFKVRILTPAYLLTGEVEENNAFLGWLNNKDKSTLDLHNVEGLVLDPNAAMPATMAPPTSLCSESPTWMTRSRRQPVLWRAMSKMA